MGFFPPFCFSLWKQIIKAEIQSERISPVPHQLLAAILAGAAAVSQPANASPVYLTCSFSDDARRDLRVTADETNAVVSIYLPSTGYAQQFRAAFGQSSIAFEDRDFEYVLSRVDMTLARTMKFLKGRPSALETGRCRIEPAVKRAF